MPETRIDAQAELHTASPYIWLADVELDDDDALRVCDGDANVTYSGNTYYAFPLTVEGYTSDGQASLPNVTVTVSALSREVADALDAGGLVDRSVQLWTLNRADTTQAFDRGRWMILDVAMTFTAASFRLGPWGLYDAPFPSRRQARSRCDYTYGGLECRYLTTLPNLVSGTYPDFDGSTCDLTIDGGNGCRAHGANEVANGRPRLHPRRFGGHPGIPKGPGRL